MTQVKKVGAVVRQAWVQILLCVHGRKQLTYEESLIKGVFSEVWEGLRYFTNLHLTAPNLMGQQKAVVLPDPGKRSWSHGRPLPQELWLWSAATTGTWWVSKGAGGVNAYCWCFPFTQTNWKPEGTGACVMQVIEISVPKTEQGRDGQSVWEWVRTTENKKHVW